MLARSRFAATIRYGSSNLGVPLRRSTGRARLLLDSAILSRLMFLAAAAFVAIQISRTYPFVCYRWPILGRPVTLKRRGSGHENQVATDAANVVVAEVNSWRMQILGVMSDPTLSDLMPLRDFVLRERAQLDRLDTTGRHREVGVGGRWDRSGVDATRPRVT